MSEVRKKRMIGAILASVAGVSAASVGAAIAIYEKMFPRHERPDYTLNPGLYCYSAVKDILPREEFYIPSCDVRLRAYLYGGENTDGLIVFTHGFRSGADDYLPIYEFFASQGFAVLAYDITGTYDSEGEGTVGMCQSFVDLDRVLDFVRDDARLSLLPVFVMGHSWGGYASGAVLALHPEIRAAALIAPMNSGMNIMMEKAEQYVGKLAAPNKPVIKAYQKLLFGEHTKYSAVDGINSTDAPVLVFHGIRDETIVYNKQSVTAHRDEITNPNATFIDIKGLQGGHDAIWHSIGALIYKEEVASEMELLRMKKGAELSDDERRAFYKTVNHRLISEVNEPLMRHILACFSSRNGKN